MIHNLLKRISSCIVLLTLTLAETEAQSIKSITPMGPRQVSVTASASGRTVLQWTFDDRDDAIWNSLGESRMAHKKRVRFLAPNHSGLVPRFRVLDRQAVIPGDSLFNPSNIRVLRMQISEADMKRMLANLPDFSGVDNGGGEVGPGGEITGGNENPLTEPDPGIPVIDPGDPGDFPDGPTVLEPEYAYVPAIASFEGGRKARIGIRIKGNASLLFAVMDKRKNYPFKLDLNYFKSGQNIDGIQKLNLHPVVSTQPQTVIPGDPPVSFPGSYGLEEYLSYGAFRAFGVPASRTGWMDVYLNGEYLGLYTCLENTDSKFMERNFGKFRGATYKPEGEYLDWKGSDYGKYQFLNWKGGGDGKHTSILRFLDIINHQPVTSYPDVVDVQSVFNYTAGNVALGNWDTYEALGHNFLLYEGQAGRFQMLPWDMNLSQAAHPGNSLYGKTEAPTLEGEQGMPAPALTDKIYDTPENDARYRATLRAFIEGPASENALNARIDDAVALLGARLNKDAIEILRSNIKTRLEIIEEMLDKTGAQ